MSERKVLNKYFPPNFDPSKVPKRKRAVDVKDKRHKVRLMAPFSMQCAACHEYIYKGTKFNAIKETVKGEDYIGLKIFRFYIRCGTCHNEITFKTDPQHTDYVAENGCYRNFNHKRDLLDISMQLQDDQLQSEELNPLLALQNKTEQSKREMLIMDHLDELKSNSRRLDSLMNDHLLDKKELVDVEEEDDEDDFEEQAKLAFSTSSKKVDALLSIRLAVRDEEDPVLGSDAAVGTKILKRFKPEDDDKADIRNWSSLAKKRSKQSPHGALISTSFVKVAPSVALKSAPPVVLATPSLSLGLTAYDSNEDSSD